MPLRPRLRGRQHAAQRGEAEEGRRHDAISSDRTRQIGSVGIFDAPNEFHWRLGEVERIVDTVGNGGVAGSAKDVSSETAIRLFQNALHGHR